MLTHRDAKGTSIQSDPQENKAPEDHTTRLYSTPSKELLLATAALLQGKRDTQQDRFSCTPLGILSQLSSPKDLEAVTQLALAALGEQINMPRSGTTLISAAVLPEMKEVFVTTIGDSRAFRITIQANKVKCAQLNAEHNSQKGSLEHSRLAQIGFSPSDTANHSIKFPENMEYLSQGRATYLSMTRDMGSRDGWASGLIPTAEFIHAPLSQENDVLELFAVSSDGCKLTEDEIAKKFAEFRKRNPQLPYSSFAQYIAEASLSSGDNVSVIVAQGSAIIDVYDGHGEQGDQAATIARHYFHDLREKFAGILLNRSKAGKEKINLLLREISNLERNGYWGQAHTKRKLLLQFVDSLQTHPIKDLLSAVYHKFFGSKNLSELDERYAGMEQAMYANRVNEEIIRLETMPHPTFAIFAKILKDLLAEAKTPEAKTQVWELAELFRGIDCIDKTPVSGKLKTQVQVVRVHDWSTESFTLSNLRVLGPSQLFLNRCVTLFQRMQQTFEKQIDFGAYTKFLSQFCNTTPDPKLLEKKATPPQGQRLA